MKFLSRIISCYTGEFTLVSSKIVADSKFIGHAGVTDVYDCGRESIEDTVGYNIITQFSMDGPQCVKLCFMIKILEKGF